MMAAADEDGSTPCVRCGLATWGDPLCVNCRLAEVVRRFTPRDPRWRYFQHGGWLFGWSTERMGDGRFAAFVLKPVGPGARTGKAVEWVKVRELHFAKRSTAKARALRWKESHAARTAKAAS